MFKAVSDVLKIAGHRRAYRAAEAHRVSAKRDSPKKRRSAEGSSRVTKKEQQIPRYTQGTPICSRRPQNTSPYCAYCAPPAAIASEKRRKPNSHLHRHRKQRRNPTQTVQHLKAMRLPLQNARPARARTTTACAEKPPSSSQMSRIGRAATVSGDV